MPPQNTMPTGAAPFIPTGSAPFIPSQARASAMNMMPINTPSMMMPQAKTLPKAVVFKHHSGKEYTEKDIKELMEKAESLAP